MITSTLQNRLAIWCPAAVLFLISTNKVQAQAPVLDVLIPATNAVGTSRIGILSATYNQVLSQGSANGIQVFSSYSGRRTSAQPAVVSGNTISFLPETTPYQPGETVQYSLTRAITGSGGVPARARVGQFTTATGGSGQGYFRFGFNSGGYTSPFALAVGMIDNNSAPDLLVVNQSQNTVTVSLNTGNGSFRAAQNISVGEFPNGIAVADVDGDGDLDFLTSNAGFIYQPSTVSVRLNNGNGQFSNAPNVNVGMQPSIPALGDLDGDGDLDLLVPNMGFTPQNGTVSIRFNDGNGTFSGNQAIATSGFPGSVALGDVDADGDLDFLVPDSYFFNAVSVHLNNGSGIFSTTGASFAVGNTPTRVVLSDVDLDGDLDLATANLAGNSVSIRFNNGLGVFTGGSEVPVGNSPRDLKIGDVNADGYLDIVTVNDNAGMSTASIRLNLGTGVFGSGTDVALGSTTRSMALCDADADLDLDLFATNGSSSAISVLLNQSTPLATASVTTTLQPTLFPNPSSYPSLSGVSPFATVMLFDSVGNLVLKTKANASGVAQLYSAATLPTGLYLVRTGTTTLRWMKQ